MIIFNLYDIENSLYYTCAGVAEYFDGFRPLRFRVHFTRFIPYGISPHSSSDDRSLGQFPFGALCMLLTYPCMIPYCPVYSFIGLWQYEHVIFYASCISRYHSAFAQPDSE